MKYYFETEERQNELKQVLDSWVGTPWRHHCGVKGRGADCIHFVAGVLMDCGALTWKKGMIPDYAPDWHMHKPNSRMWDGIRKALTVEHVDPANPMNGDLMLFRFGYATSHSAIFFEGLLYQAVNVVGVQKLRYDDKRFAKNLTYSLRLCDVG